MGANPEPEQAVVDLNARYPSPTRTDQKRPTFLKCSDGAAGRP